MALFWLSEGAWTAIEPNLPGNQPGARRVRRSAGDLGYRPRAESGLPVVRLPGRLRFSTTIYNRDRRSQ